MQFYSFSRSLAKDFHIPRKRTRQRCQVRNLHFCKNFKRKTGRTRKASYVSRRAEHFEEKNLAKNQNFLTFGQWARNCRFLGEVFLKGLSTPHFLCPEKSFETKVFFSKKKSKFDIFFWFRMKKFGICGRSFQQGCQRQNSRDQRKFLVKLRLDERTTLNLFMVFVRKICFAENSRFVSKAFYASNGTF